MERPRHGPPDNPSSFMTPSGNVPLLTALGAIVVLAGVSYAKDRGEDPSSEARPSFTVASAPEPGSAPSVASAPEPGPAPSIASAPDGRSDAPARAPLQALVLGDWGTGQEGQRQIAEAIAAAHGDSPPDLVLSVGDNFYPSGVTDLEDPLWKSVFEDVYQGPFWQGKVFFPVLGNHDHRGNPGAEFAYSQVNPSWDMPGAYYAFRKPLGPGDSVLFLALDTEPMRAGGSDVSPQLQWADSTLGSSKDAWVVAYGHHPVASGGRHAPDREVRRLLVPVMDHRVSVYLSGHNHSTEFLLTDDGFEQAVCGGAGGRTTPTRSTLTSAHSKPSATAGGAS